MYIQPVSAAVRSQFTPRQTFSRREMMEHERRSALDNYRRPSVVCSEFELVSLMYDGPVKQSLSLGRFKTENEARMLAQLVYGPASEGTEWAIVEIKLFESFECFA